MEKQPLLNHMEPSITEQDDNFSLRFLSSRTMYDPNAPSHSKLIIFLCDRSLVIQLFY